MKKTLKISIITTGFLLAATVNAAVPNEFSAGQAASAAEVNANFTNVDQKTLTNASDIQINVGDIQTNVGAIQTNTNAVAALPTVAIYDYRNFVADADVVSKTFTTTGLCGDTEVRTRVATPNGVNTDITITRRRLMGATTCQLSDLLYVNTPTQRQVVGNNSFSSIDDSLQSSKVPAEPIVVATTSMREGSPLANGTSVDETPVGGSAAFLGTLVDVRIIIGLEDIRIGAADYPDCLKTSTIRRSIGFGEFHRTSWNCPGLGEVKRVQVNTFPSSGTATRRYQIWEMSDVVRATP